MKKLFLFFIIFGFLFSQEKFEKGIGLSFSEIKSNKVNLKVQPNLGLKLYSYPEFLKLNDKNKLGIGINIHLGGYYALYTEEDSLGNLLEKYDLSVNQLQSIDIISNHEFGFGNLILHLIPLQYSELEFGKSFRLRHFLYQVEFSFKKLSSHIHFFIIRDTLNDELNFTNIGLYYSW